jgi:ABC-type multidrug transport system fused ATPase/permease subunit
MLSFGGWAFAFLTISLTLIVQIVYFAGPYWLSIWTEAYEPPNVHPNTAYYLAIYAAAIVSYLCLQVLNILAFQAGGWNAAKKMHSKLVHAILFAPLSWFDKNPIGRAVNRFGNDTRSMDVLLAEYLRQTVHNALRLILRIASIASVMPIFALPAAIICSIGFVVGEMYTRAQVSIKRLVSVNYSPVFVQFTDTIAGMGVIRARDGMDGMFQKLLAQKIAVHARSTEAQYNSNRWVSIRSDICAATVSAAAGFVAYTQRGSAGLVGFSLSNAVGMSQTILILVRTMNELEVELNSFQHMKEYAAIEPEESETKEKDGPQNQVRLPPAWWHSRMSLHAIMADPTYCEISALLPDRASGLVSLDERAAGRARWVCPFFDLPNLFRVRSISMALISAPCR